MPNGAHAAGLRYERKGRDGQMRIRRPRTYFFLITLTWAGRRRARSTASGASRWETLRQIREFVEENWEVPDGAVVVRFTLEPDRLS